MIYSWPQFQMFPIVNLCRSHLIQFNEFNFEIMCSLDWLSNQQLSFLSLFTLLTFSCTQSSKLREYDIDGALASILPDIVYITHFWILTKGRTNETGAFCVCMQLPVLNLVSWCGVHGVMAYTQVGDDRPVLEARCTLTSCSPVVVWALFGWRVSKTEACSSFWLGPFPKG